LAQATLAQSVGPLKAWVTLRCKFEFRVQ